MHAASNREFKASGAKNAMDPLLGRGLSADGHVKESMKLKHPCSGQAAFEIDALVSVDVQPC